MQESAVAIPSGSLALLIWLAVCHDAHSATSVEAPTIRTRVIAQSGQLAPDLEFAFELDQLVDATINDRGDVVYRATTNRSFQGIQRAGLWIDPAQEDEPDRFMGILDFLTAPGTPSREAFLGVSLPILSDTGEALATQFLDAEPARRTTGVWLATEQAVTPVLLPGQQAPGLSSGEFLLNSPTGRAFTSQGYGLVSALTDQGNSPLWRYSQGDLELLEVTRSPFSLLPGFEFTAQELGGKINDQGTVAIVADVTNGTQRINVLFQIAADGSRDLVVRSHEGGTEAPGAFPGSTFLGLNNLLINNQGTISFSAEYRTPFGEQGGGIWFKELDQPLQPLVVTGMSTPAKDATFDTVIASGLNNNINDLGQIGFSALLELNNGETVRSSWIGSEEGLELLAIDGQQAPGFSSGVTLLMEMPQLNDRGTAFARARLSGPGITSDTNSVFFYRLAGGELTPLLQEGQIFEVAPGDARRVVAFDTPIAEAGRVVGINNRNEVVLTLQFEDATSAVVVFAIIPEPSALLLAAIAGMATAKLR